MNELAGVHEDWRGDTPVGRVDGEIDAHVEPPSSVRNSWSPRAVTATHRKASAQRIQ